MSENREVMESTSKVLKDASDLKINIQAMREQLQRLLNAKKEGNSQPSTNDKHLIQHFTRMQIMRQKHRRIQLNIEEERTKIRTEKEKIEKTSVYLSGLEYLQSTIDNSIQKCQSVQMKSLPSLNSDNVKGVLKRKPISDFEGEDFMELRTVLNDELHKRIKMNEECSLIGKELSEKKQKHDVLISQFSQQLPPLLNALADNMKGLNTLFTPVTLTPLPINPIQHALAAFLPSPLYCAYSKLATLFDYTPSLASSIDIVSLNNNTLTTKRQNEIFHLELQVTIKDYIPSLLNSIDTFLLNSRISLSRQTISQLYPIKIFIRYINNLNTLIVQLDSKFFKGKEIFSGLFEKDFGSTLIPFANDEYDKNLNQQYECYNWLQILGGITNRGDTTLKIDANLIIRKINERIISKRVTKSIIEALGLNSIEFTPLLKSQKEMVNPAELGKYKFELKHKLSNASELASSVLFRKLRPSQLKKTTDSHDLIEEELNEQKLLHQINSVRASASTHSIQQCLSHGEVMKMLGLENESNEAEVYIFSVSKTDQFKAIVIFIMPLSTLVQLPQVHILSGSIKMSSPIRTPLTTLFEKEVIVQIQEPHQQTILDSLNMINVSSLITNQIEYDLSQITSLLPDTSNISFGLLYQINRLVSLFEITLNHFSRSLNLSSKCFASTSYEMLDI